MADTRVRVILSAVDQGMTKGLNAAKSAVKDLQKSAKTAAGGMNSAKSALSRAGSAAKSVAMKFKAVQKAAAAFKATASMIRGVGSAFRSAFSTIKNSSSTLTGVKAVFGQIKTAGVSAATTIASKFRSSFSGLGASIKAGLGQMLIGGLRWAGAMAVMGIGNGVRSMVQEVSDVNKTWNNFRQTMKLTHGDTAQWNGQLVSTARYTKLAERSMKSYAAKTIYSSAQMSQTFAQLDAVGTKGTASLVRGFGNVASFAENPIQAMKSVSTQATQMAAKPKVAWQDFKIMLEQAPAGIAQVAKKMGKSTKELVADVQAGKVKTEDFFVAMRKVGNDKSLTKHAAQYRSIGEAIQGAKDTLALRLTPAFDVFQKSALKGLNSIIGKMASIDGVKLAKSFQSGMATAKKSWGNFKAGLDAAGVSKSFSLIKDAVKSVADSFSGLAKSKAGMDICRAAGVALGAALRVVAIAAQVFAAAFKVAVGVIKAVVSVIRKLVNAANKVASAFKKAKAAIEDFFNVKTKDDITGKMDKLSSKAGNVKTTKKTSTSVSVNYGSTTNAANAGKRQGASYKSGLQQGLAGTSALVLNASNGAASALGTGIGRAGANGRATGFGFKAGVGQANGAIGIGRGAAFGTGAALGSGIGAAGANGRATGFGFASGVGTARQGIGTARNAAGAAARAMDRRGAAHASGVSVGSGFAAGIASMFGRVVAAASRLASAATAKLNSVIKKGSPSKVTRISGKSFGQGFVVGIKSQEKAVRKAALNLVTFPQLQAPTFSLPNLATAGGYGGAVSGGYNSAGDNGLMVTIVTELDGKTVARKTAKFMRSEINTLDKKADRRKGVR